MKRSLCVLSVLILACYVFSVLLPAHTGRAAPAPKPSLNGWGDPVDLDNDCKIQLDRGVLSIEMPGTEHEFDPARNRFNAPRIVREIKGDFDLRVRIRIDCPRSAQSSVEGHPAYVTAGFLIIYPDSTRCKTFCDRLDYGFIQQRVGIDDFPEKTRWLVGSQIESESRKGIGEDGCVLENGWSYGGMATEIGGRFQHNALILLDRGWSHWPLQRRADCVYLRVKREDQEIGFSISPNGEKWSPLNKIIWAGRPKKIKVGLAAYTTSGQPSKVRFDQIRIWRPREKMVDSRGHSGLLR